MAVLRALIATLLVAAAAAAAVTSASAGSPARAVAQATLASGSLGTYGAASARGDESSEDTFSVDARGVRVGTAIVQVRASRSASPPVADAKATARSLRLLDGLVTAWGAFRHVTVTPDGSTVTGRVTGLRIGERFVEEVKAARTYPLPDDAGSVRVNSGSAAVVVTLTQPANGFPAGTTVTVADVGGSVRAAVADRPKPKPETGSEPETQPDDAGDPAKAQRQKERTNRRAERRREDRANSDRLAAERFVFPVFGTGVTVADDFGAPRAVTVEHQGNDVFGPFGAPVLAVADGTVRKVGTLPISGNRLWLRTDDGDAFFYAHLSAFAPAAVSGERVRKGELLGFVGNTGQAETTPPHVHFEIHPGNGRAIDPYPVLEAWRRGDAPAGPWLARYGEAPAPGALVAVEDYIDE